LFGLQLQGVDETGTNMVKSQNCEYSAHFSRKPTGTESVYSK